MHKELQTKLYINTNVQYDISVLSTKIAQNNLVDCQSKATPRCNIKRLTFSLTIIILH